MEKIRLLIINPIMYSSESKTSVPKVSSIKDTLIYNLCLSFYEKGIEVELYTNSIYKPTVDENYPFKIIWDEPVCQKIFLPAALPYLKNLRKYLRENKNHIDMVITSEVFQMTSLISSIVLPAKTIIWHETARHNHVLKEIPSKIWYSFIAPIFMKQVNIVPRSKEAQMWISNFLPKVLVPIEHGINERIFRLSTEKEDYFICVAQLIKRKRIDKIIDKFEQFLKTEENRNYKLFICGTGEEGDRLKEKVQRINLSGSILFLGKLDHKDLVPLMQKARALLVNSEKENSMVSIIESIAVGTPVITTKAPLNCSYIESESLGIVSDEWNDSDMEAVIEENERYVDNCKDYRNRLLNSTKVNEFVEVYNNVIKYKNSR